MKHDMTTKQLLDAAGPVSRFVPAQTAGLIMEFASAMRQLRTLPHRRAGILAAG